jgi:thiol:disulfide interchange protein
MKRFLTLLFLLALLSTKIYSVQIQDPVKWTFSLKKDGNNYVELIYSARIQDKWHLYSPFIPPDGPIPTSFNYNLSKGFMLSGKLSELSKAEEKFDANFGIKLRMFSHIAVFRQKVKLLSDTIKNIAGYVEFMSCDDKSCMAPRQVSFQFEVAHLFEKASDNASQAQIAVPSTLTRKSTTPNLTKPSVKVSKTVVNRSLTSTSVPVDRSVDTLWSTLLLAFFSGLLGVFTPCVFPMIPMTVTFFMRGKEKKGSSFLNASVFGLSIIFIYTLIGVIVALFNVGSSFANTLSTHWIPNLLFFLLFVVFSASFLGMFELVLPGKWANKTDNMVDKGGVLSSFFMALTLVIVSFSCTGPLVGAVLVEAARGGVALKPVLGMFTFGFAFALPFTLFATFPSMLKSLPKSGGWLNVIKVVLGFILLAFSFKYLSIIDQTHHLGLLSRSVFLSIWIVIACLTGFYLLGKLKFSHDTVVENVSVPRLFMAIVFFTFALYLIPGLFGAPLYSVSSLIPPQEKDDFSFTSNAKETVTSTLCNVPKYSDILSLPYGLQGYFDYKEGMACARKQNKPVFLDFKGHACSNCKLMESKVWSHPEILKRLDKNFIIVALYVDDRTVLPKGEWTVSPLDGSVNKTLGQVNADFQASKYGINTQPYYLIVDTTGKILSGPVSLETEVSKFAKFLDEGAANFSISTVH